uniref:photosystem II protein Z n=1 Tax=Haramonas pauciplastida TaxID=478668 RepID=UPI00211596D7|nr:photosystem II protein Z [Haramonas pauciplastida]UTE94985.1 photosystem II protein Z [Haramonas pauciplastida]
MLVGLLVLLSFVLIITVPISLATPGEWETNKSTFYNLTKFWGTLIILTGFANVFV